MQIVAVQLNTAWEDRAPNHRRVRELLENLKLAEPALIILPEMFDVGFSMNVAATLQSEAREAEQFLRDLARTHNAAVLGGVISPDGNGQGKNEAVAFAPSGEELVRYRKMQPFTLSGEDQAYGSGDSHQTFEWGGLKIAPFICYDLRFPERFRPAARDGAELIIVIACWPDVRSEHWVRLLQARAIENLAFTVGVNRCGTDPEHTFDGRSAAFDPMGEALFEADPSEQILITELDVQQVRSWRSKFPALDDMRD